MEIIADSGQISIIGYIDGNYICDDNRYLIKIFPKSNSVSVAEFYTNCGQLETGKFATCKSIEDVVRCVKCQSTSTITADEWDFVAAILPEIESVGLERLEYISEDMCTLHFRYVDDASRCHLLKLQLKHCLPLTVSNINVDLPDHFEFKDDCDLTALFERFVEAVDNFQEFWTELFLLDQNEAVSKIDDDIGMSSKTRRIVLDHSVCVLLTLNPKHPKALPEFSLTGPEASVVFYKTRIDSKLDSWCEAKSVFENLTEIFGNDLFAAGPTQRRVASEAQCSICYSYESAKDEIPDQTCLQCKQQFHKSCLYNWLRKQSTQRLSFGTVFGPCPYCNKTIKVKLITM